MEREQRNDVLKLFQPDGGLCNAVCDLRIVCVCDFIHDHEKKKKKRRKEN